MAQGSQVYGSPWCDFGCAAQVPPRVPASALSRSCAGGALGVLPSHTQCASADAPAEPAGAQELDPTGKFASESNVWAWQATQNGTAVPFASCCSPQGFLSSQCTCASRTDCDGRATAPVSAADGYSV